LFHKGLLDLESASLTVCNSLGKLAPGNADIDAAFKHMWKEAEKNPTKMELSVDYYLPRF
jgi:hypothetical protein